MLRGRLALYALSRTLALADILSPYYCQIISVLFLSYLSEVVPDLAVASDNYEKIIVLMTVSAR
jgi:hypothetical protein